MVGTSPLAQGATPETLFKTLPSTPQTMTLLTQGSLARTLYYSILYSLRHDYTNYNFLFLCSVSKRIAMNGVGEDLDLSTDLYVLYARRTTASTTLTTLESHSSALRSMAIRASSTVRYTVTTASTSALPTIAPVRAPEDYRLQILSPTNCSPADCDLFIGIDTNAGDDGFLDIYMEGTAEGWVAVGFSETANMVSCSVQ